MSKILIIEDEMTIVDLISFNLKREGLRSMPPMTAFPVWKRRCPAGPI